MEVLQLRYKKWEEAARTMVFSWRRPLLASKDDMSLESDRDLLRGMLKKFQKNPRRFSLFNEKDVEDAVVEDSKFDVESAFKEHWSHLLNGLSPQNLAEELFEEPVIKEKRGPGRPPKKKPRPSWYMVEEPIQPSEAPNRTASLTEKSATPDTGGRPKRQAARLSFASGAPVQSAATITEDDQFNETPAPRGLKSKVSKILTLPVSLPTSPETKKDVLESPGLRKSQHQSTTSDAGRPLRTGAQGNLQPTTETIDRSTLFNGLPNEANGFEQAQGVVPNGLMNAPNQRSPQIAAVNASSENIFVPENIGSNVLLADLQTKYATLEQEHDLLSTKYRRWRSGVVDNAKLLVDQEQDLEAKKDIINESNQTIKQLFSDNAKLGAELALARGMVQYNPALLRQSFLRGSLTPDVVERLFNNPDFIQLLQPRPANGEIAPPPPTSPPPPPPPTQRAPQPAQDTGSARPKKRRRITAADALTDAEADEARQKKLSRVIAPTIKRLEKSRFNLSATDIENLFDADTAESKRFLDSLIDFAKLPIDFDQAYVLIKEAQQDRKQGRVVVPQLRLSDPMWAPWDVKTAQKRYMQREGMIEDENGEIVKKKPKSMEEMVAEAKAVREATKRRDTIEADETILSDDESPAPATDDARRASASRRGGRSESEFRRVWERHEELRREREQREQEEQRAALPPLDMTDPLQALAASMFTSVNGSVNKGKGRASAINGRRRPGSPKQYLRREPSEDVDMDGDDEPMELSDSS